jgi:serine/threonine-protein phosphatase Stp1
MTGFPASFPLRVLCAARSHEGQVRGQNEDSFLCSAESRLWAVADGMGGLEQGEWASAALVDELRCAPLSESFTAACDEVAERIHRANRKIYDEAVRREAQIGSTIVALLTRQRRFAVFWVGDSRAYLLRHGVLHQLSSDHSQLQELVDRGLLSPEQVAGHPMSHVLSRAVGVAEEVELDVVEDEVEAGDVFLLCSDGLHGCVDRQDIARLVAQPYIERIADDLVTLTLERGAPDNVTVVTVQFSEPTLIPTQQQADAL